MKTLIVLILSASAIFGQISINGTASLNGNIGLTTPSGALATPDLLNEDFTTGSIPAGWTADAATPNFAYQWPALKDTYSLGITNFDANARGPFTATANIKTYFQYMCTLTNTVDGRIMSLETGAGYALKVEMIRDTGSKRLFVSDAGGAHTAGPTSFINTNVLYHVWTHYVAGTGANAFLSVAWDTVPVEPTSGTANYAEITIGASTTNPDRIRFWAGGTTDNQNIYDHVGVATFNMPNGW